MLAAIALGSRLLARWPDPARGALPRRGARRHRGRHRRLGQALHAARGDHRGAPLARVERRGTCGVLGRGGARRGGAVAPGAPAEDGRAPRSRSSVRRCCSRSARSGRVPAGASRTRRITTVCASSTTSNNRSARSDVGVNSVITAFPENHTDAADASTLLIRPDAKVKPRPGRATWTPDGLVAYSKLCTHVGCPVGLYQAGEHLLLCPCHQSTFAVLDGRPADLRTGRPRAAATSVAHRRTTATSWPRATSPGPSDPASGIVIGSDGAGDDTTPDDAVRRPTPNRGRARRTGGARTGCSSVAAHAGSTTGSERRRAPGRCWARCSPTTGRS